MPNNNSCYNLAHSVHNTLCCPLAAAMHWKGAPSTFALLFLLSTTYQLASYLQLAQSLSTQEAQTRSVMISNKISDDTTYLRDLKNVYM